MFWSSFLYVQILVQLYPLSNRRNSFPYYFSLVMITYPLIFAVTNFHLVQIENKLHEWKTLQRGRNYYINISIIVHKTLVYIVSDKPEGEAERDQRDLRSDTGTELCVRQTEGAHRGQHQWSVEQRLEQRGGAGPTAVRCT